MPSWRFFLRWTCLGLLLRFLIMPFTLHTIDIFFVHYFPFKAIEQNRLDIYQYFQAQFPEYPYSYYPPLTFYLTFFFQKLFQPVLPTLASLMERFENLAFYHHGGSTVHFASVLQDPYLFRTLFLFKAHYLLFDAAIAWMLVSLARSSSHKAWAYRLWMINPLALHTSYGVGQIDILVTFFLVLSFFMFERRYPKMGMAMLGAGGLVKLAPFYLAPGVAFSTGEKLRKKFILLSSCLIPVVVLLFFSKDARVVLESWIVLAGAYWKINPSVMGISKLPLIFLLIGYGFVVFWGLSSKRKRIPLLSVFLLLLLLLWVTVSTRPRHLLWISPFLILELLSQPLIGAWLVTLLAAVWELHGAGITYRLGLLAPIDPVFFTSLPILDSFLSVVMDIRWVHRFCIAWIVMAVGVICYLIVKKDRKWIGSPKYWKIFGWGSCVAWLLAPLFLLLGVLLFGVQKLPPAQEWLVFKDIISYEIPTRWTDPLMGSQKYSQTFLCNFDGLSRIGVFVKFPKEEGPDQLVLTLRSADDPSRQIRTVVLPSKKLNPVVGDFYAVPPERKSPSGHRVYFDFEPLKESKGKRFSFTLTNPTSDSSKGISVGLVSGRSHLGWSTKQEHAAFNTYCRYQGDPRRVFGNLIQKIKEDKPFVSFYFLMLIVFWLGMVCSMGQPRRKKWNIES